MNQIAARSRRYLKIASVLLLVASSLAVTQPSPVGSAPADVGVWSDPFDLGVTGVHSIVLPNGKVLLISRKAVTTGPLARVWDPATNTSIDASHPDATRDAYCAGHSLLADGRVLVTGGNFVVGSKDGVKTVDVFDWTDNGWSPAPPLALKRWYPTNVELPNGEVLVFGGHKEDGAFANAVESYNKTATARVKLPSTATRKVGLYPRMHLLPNGTLFYSGVTTNALGAVGRFFDPATNTWSPAVDKMSFGVRADGMSVLLPGLDEVLAIGGSTLNDSTATASTEIIDLSSGTPQWRSTEPMNFARKEANSAMLPDGTLLVIGGALGGGSYENPVKESELFDPVTETWTVMDSQTAPRAHHSTAVLLPDGRVLSAGHDRGTMKTTGEIYSPPYLFKGDRPTISSAPAEVDHGEQFTLETPNSGSIERIALISAPAVTHSHTFDQRYVDLSFTATPSSLSVTAPADGAIAPPGHYMMFLLDSNGVPSVASWVHVS